MGGWVYIMASRRNGTLYAGVTSDLHRRALEHREGAIGGFTTRYGCKLLVWHERHDDIEIAIQREKSLKRYRRSWKLRLIEELNPTWSDLFETFSDADNPFRPTFTRRFDTCDRRFRANWILGTEPEDAVCPCPQSEGA